MNDLRRLAVGLIATGLVVSTVYGTGAFSSPTTQRDATVQVAGDAGGYLALQPADGANGAYASQQGGQLQVSLAGAFDGDASGSGVNPDAITSVRVTFEAGNGPIEQRELAMTVEPGESRHADLAVDTREYTGNVMRAC